MTETIHLLCSKEPLWFVIYIEERLQRRLLIFDEGHQILVTSLPTGIVAVDSLQLLNHFVSQLDGWDGDLDRLFQWPDESNWIVRKRGGKMERSLVSRQRHLASFKKESSRSIHDFPHQIRFWTLKAPILVATKAPQLKPMFRFQRFGLPDRL